MHDNNPKDNEKGYGNENNPNRQMPKIYRPQLIGGQVPNRLQAVNLGNLPPVPMFGKIPNMDNLRGQNINPLPQVMPRDIVNPPKRQIFLEDIQLPGFEELFGQENQQIEPVQQVKPAQQVVQPTNGNFRYANDLNDPQVLKDWDDYLESIQLAKGTRYNYKRYIKWFFDYMKVQKISNPSLDDVLNYIRYEKVVKNTTIEAARIVISGIRRFFTWTSTYNMYPNIMLRVFTNMVDEIYKEKNQVPQELSDPNSEDNEFRALEEILGAANQQLQPRRRGQQLKPQNAFSGLQQAQDYIELQQKKDRLKEMLDSLAGLGRIDDPKVKEAWELYLGIYAAGKSTDYKYQIQLYVNEFLDCLEGDSKSNPSSENILGFIESIKKARGISCGTAQEFLYHIKFFFRFVSEFGIYDDVSLGLTPMHIREIYGVVPPSKKPRIRKTLSSRVLLVMKKRQVFEQIMQEDYPNHKLDPEYITAYIHDIKGDSDYFKPLLCLREYLEKNHISELIINDITTFIVNNKDMFRTNGSIFNFLEQLKQFFAWTSKNTSLDGQILYPDIGKFLDGVDLIDALLMRLDPNNHVKNKQQDRVKPGSIRDLMECLGLETESSSEEQ